MENGKQLQHIKITKIEANDNIRVDVDEKLAGLMADVKNRGLLQPIGVWKKNNSYLVAYGNRRLTACRKLGWVTIPCLVMDDMGQEEFLTTNIAENIHREDITPVELGRMCVKLKEQLNASNREIAVLLNFRASVIDRCIVLWNELPPKFRKDVAFQNKSKSKNGKLGATLVNSILTLKIGEKLKEQLLTVAKKNEFTLRQVTLVKVMLNHGMSLQEAIKSIDKVRIVNVDLIVDTKQIKKVLGNRNLRKYVVSVLKGQTKPIPSLIKGRVVGR